jgi:hypothetical protein
MRRSANALALVALLLLALPAAASAVPTVTFKALAVKIPGYPDTGNILGAGAAVKAEYRITGTEYLGAPPPITHVNFYLPKGAKLHTAGFPTCAKTTLEQLGPIGCKRTAAAGPIGRVEGFVNFGHEPVEETLALSSYYAPGGGIYFFTKGTDPTLIEIISSGHYVHLGGGGGYGPEIETEVPLVPSVPGAPFASVKTITVEAGSAIGPKNPKRATYYGRVPKTCPKGGFPIKTEVTFAENGEISKPETVTKTYKAPCPRKAAKRR